MPPYLLIHIDIPSKKEAHSFAQLEKACTEGGRAVQ